MEIAKSDGYGTDAVGVRRKIIAGQPIPPNLKVETEIVAPGEELGHINPEVQGDHVSDVSLANQDEVEAEQRFRSDVEGSKAARAGRPTRSIAQGAGPEAGQTGDTEDLAGQALKDRAAELEIEGRSQMNADELRAAIAEKEAQ